MTTEPLRIGLNMGSNEPYWVMVREAIIQHAPNLPVQLVHLEIDQFHDWSRREVELTVDGLRAQRVGAIISWGMPESFSLAALDAGMIIFIAAEARLRHPRLLGLSTLYDSAREVGGLVMRSLNGKGHVLAVEGVALMDGNTDSRGQGFRDAAKRYPSIQLTGLPIPYPPVDPQPYIEAALLELDQPADAIVCASDYLALQVSKAARSMGLLPAGGLVAGIGGDPLALEAIARGEMTATVDITPPALCCKILEYTWKMMRGQPVAGPLKFSTNLVTIQNVTEVMKEKFLTVARLPSRMVGVNREQQLRHTDQLEWSLQVIRRLSASLDRRQVLDEITQMVRDRYHYDRAYVYFWSQDHQALLRDDTLSSEVVVPMVRLTDGGLVGQVYVDARPVVILDAQHSAVYPLDMAYPHTRSRTILPIRLGETVTGVLDLHSHQLMDQDQEDLLGLQLLADQVGIAFRNARLYEDALRSLRLSEEADRLKTRLLANVSHELRTPLNLILSYSKLGLRDLHQQDDLREDLQVIQTSAVHLQRLINDLLDLSRAEID
ncbi:MAG: substrate-binding domain-containing protein, partial [Anaerolineae bacterium]|nr:substrate-binding domain-containing protein [Anaerolineae bacterium]